VTNSQRPIPRIDPDLSVDDALRRYPAAAAVLNAFGVDACCGGARSIRAAAREDGADCCALLAALELAAAEGA
jgi:iron-sulfur cluster repair protein YtfE (RIC family)